jgi:hypothetical protein
MLKTSGIGVEWKGANKDTEMLNLCVVSPNNFNFSAIWG